MATKVSISPNGNNSSFYRLHTSRMDKSDGVIVNEPKLAENLFKIVIVGDYAVGKSCIVSRLCDDFFRETHSTTVGIDYKVRTLLLPDKRQVKMEIFDTAGLDKFRAIASNYYQNASGVVIVYDITDENSFEKVGNYLRELKYFIPPDAEILLIGNKADMVEEGERRVQFEEADKYAAKMGLSIFEVSAKTGLNVEAAFLELAQKIHEKIEVGTFDKEAQGIVPDLVFGEPDNPITKTRSMLGCILCCI